MVEKENKQTRRKFLLNLGILGAVILAILAFARGLFQFVFPERKEKRYHKYLVCKEGEIPRGKAKEITLGQKPIFIVHLEEGYKVFSGVCTHLGCVVQWKSAEGHFYCPCHKGYFAKTGEVISGPPPRPLDEYEVRVEKNLVYIQVEEKIRGPWA
ncbi:MAG: hypothetical protein Kow0042_24960 [Calditrichia bacterium]